MSLSDIWDIGSKIYDVVGPPIIRRCGYAIFCKTHASGLKGQIKKLTDAEARVLRSVDESRSRGESIHEDVVTWLNDADRLIESGGQILDENKVRWFLGFVPDPKSCYKLGRNANELVPVIQNLFLEGKFESVSYRRVDELPLILGSATSAKRNYVALRSRTSIQKLVMEALDDDDIRVIGVYGMGGVGKTTLLKEVEKEANASRKFDGVFSTFISPAPNMTKIRADIEYKMGRVRFDGSKKTVLVLLDDLWKEFDLKDIGVPESDNKLKIKLVLTSRNHHLLKEMNCHPNFSLGVSDEKEGWRFFAELLDSSSNRKIEELKRNSKTAELLRKCAGLPVSIEALATIWKKNKIMNSSDTSDKLINAELDELNHGKESPDGSASLELSYNYLGDSRVEKQTKSLFRTIGIFRTPNVPILTLLKYSIGLGLFNRSTSHSILERARREITRSLRALQDSSLLLESDGSDHINIHDVVRDVAVTIASRDDNALIFNPEDGVKEWSLEKLSKCMIISLPYSAILELHEGWTCPELNVFTMEAEQGDHVGLPDSFFIGMVKLRVIHLKNIRFTMLPSSTQSDVQTLTTLCLDYCCLENVAEIGKLKSLQALSLIGSDITSLPEEVGGLTCLRMLDLSKCSKLETIKPGIFRRLIRLEELYLKESFDQWEVEGVGQPSNSSLTELNHMPQLNTLELRIPHTSQLPPNLPFEQLVRYKVLIGDAWEWSGGYKESRTLKLTMSSRHILSKQWLQCCFGKVQDLHLGGLNETMKSFHELCIKGFEQLKHLHLQESSSTKYIIWSTEWLACSTFMVLESMHLEKLERLEKICHGLISATTFSKLKVLKVQQCDKLKNLFNLSLVKGLTELEEIEVSDCEAVQEVVIAEQIDDDDDDDGAGEDSKVANIGCSYNLFCCPTKRLEVSKTKADAIEGSRKDYETILGNLRCITLRELPEMKAFFTNLNEPVENSVPTLFHDQQVSLPSRKPKKLLSPPVKTKEIQPSSHLGVVNLTRVVLEYCNKIENFVNSRMLLQLVSLESLTIASCESLESIFDLEGVDANIGSNEILPKLYELKLKELPKLVHIWKKNSKQLIKGCRSLRRILIAHCNNLSYLSSSWMCGSMENLTEINIMNCPKMENIFEYETGMASDTCSMIQLISLKILVILKCPDLREFLSCPSINSSTASKCGNSGMTNWCRGKQQDHPDDPCIITFFSQKVSLPSLENLVLSDAGKFEKLWCSEIVPDQSFCNLKLVDVTECRYISTVFPTTLVERLHKLNLLWVQDCIMLETLISGPAVSMETKRKPPQVLLLTQLQEIKLHGLINLRNIVERYSEIMVALPSLEVLDVSDCHRLTHLIPTSTATTLLKLRTLYISLCPRLEQVIHGEVSDTNKRELITFPYLTSLTMLELPWLAYFCSENYFLDFTSLKIMEINVCQRLKTMVKPGSDAHQGSQALFSDKIEFPALEVLTIEAIEVEELWSNNLPMDSFCMLKALTISACSKLENIIPSFMTNKLQNLEHMTIKHYDHEPLEDIFKITSTHVSRVLEDDIVDDESDSEENTQATESGRVVQLTKLASLELYGDIKFSNLRSGSYTLELPSLQKLELIDTVVAVGAIMDKVPLLNLEKLLVCGGNNIVELWHTEPPVGSFRKLKHLGVERIRGLKKIIPSFMLKRLQNLEMLVVTDCKDLEILSELESIYDNIGEESGSILSSFPFQRLASIDVQDCKCLENFFSISATDSSSSNKIVLPISRLRLERLPNLSHLYQSQLAEYTLELSFLEEFFLINSGVKEAITQKVVLPEELEVHYADDHCFFGSPKTVTRNIITASTHRSSNEIIGLHGKLSEEARLNPSCEIRELLEGEAKITVKLVCIDDIFDGPVLRRDGDKIQEKLGRVLEIIFIEAGIQRRAPYIREAVLNNRDTRLVVVLTCYRQGLDFEALGIPHPREVDPNFFKLIVISHKREVLEKMGAHQEMIINIGWNSDMRWRWIFETFPEEANYILAKELADECGSDNLAAHLALKLDGRGFAAWEDALQRLKGSPFTYEARNHVIRSL